ncbi:MAG: helix-turn-helix domain-containing protein, partial [Saccharofermentans sp.]|nr:helix-turn-helix domain-containing protein [Saccharofermentans sp.]
MYATKEERLAIGKRIHDGELTIREASKEYDISERTISKWVAQYRESIG